LWLAGGLALMLMLGGCGNQTGAGAGSTANTVVIGVLLPLTGAAATIGLAEKAAIQLAADLINTPSTLNLPAVSGSGLPNLGGTQVSLIFGDTQGDAIVAASEAARLINAGAVALIGCYHSAATKTAAQIANGRGIPFLNPDSTAPDLTQQGYTTFFRTTPSDATFVNAFFSYMNFIGHPISPANNGLTIVYENGTFGTGINTLATSTALTTYLTVASSVPYSATATSFTTQASQIALTMPRTLLQASYTSDAIGLIQAYKTANIVPKMIVGMDAGFTDPLFLNNLGVNAEKIVSRATWNLDLTHSNTLAASVNTLYKANTGSDLDDASARAFTGAMTLLDAINRAGTSNASPVLAALSATNLPASQLIMPWAGISFDIAGQNTLGSSIMIQVQNGTWKTVWPASVATAGTVYPFPAWTANPR